jgi:hypothetical protein
MSDVTREDRLNLFIEYDKWRKGKEGEDYRTYRQWLEQELIKERKKCALMTL